MRIGAVSDIHVDINTKRENADFKKLLIEYINSLDLNVLIIPGDVAGSVNEIISFFDLSKKLSIPHKIYVPGNHDIWAYGEIKNGSWIKYREMLPTVCNELNWHYLPGNPVKIGNVGIFGSMGWYDYSSANHKWDNLFSENDYEKKISPSNAKWMDIEYAKFNMDDKTVANILLKEIENDFLKLGFEKSNNSTDNYPYKIPENTGISTVISVTHIVPFLDFIDFKQNPGWDFFGAFIGNLNIGKFLKKLPQNLKKLAFFGHTHFPNSGIVQNNIEAYCVPLGYPQEYGGKPLFEVFKERVKVVEV